MLRPTLLWLALPFLYACNCGSPTPPPTPDGGTSDGGPRTVQGKRTEVWLTEAGEVNRPVDLSQAKIEALVPSATGFAVQAGTGRSDGTFTIEKVPAGAYYLRLDNFYFVTSADAPELFSNRVGRGDGIRADAGTQLAFNLTGLAPFQVGKDTMMLFSSNNGANGWSFEGSLSARPDAGATVLSGTLDYTRMGGPWLVEAAKGDSFHVTQLVGVRNTTGTDYLAAQRVWQNAGLTMPQGGATAITGAFQAVANTHAATVNWRRSEFNGFTSQVGPGAQAVAPWYISVMGSRHPANSGLPTLIMNYIGQPGATDVDVGRLEYGDPFPSSWRSLLRVTALWNVPLTFGSSRPATRYLWYSEYQDVNALVSGTVRPTMSPPRNVTVNGVTAATPRAQVGPRAVVAWEPPTLGAPVGYLVTVLELSDVGGGTSIKTLGSVATTALSMTLPTELWPAQGTFVLEVKAVGGAGGDMANQPLRRLVPYVETATLTANLQP